MEAREAAKVADSAEGMVVGLEAADSVVAEMAVVTEEDLEEAAREDDERHTRPSRTCP